MLQNDVTIYTHSPFEDPNAEGITVPLGQTAAAGAMKKNEGELQLLQAVKNALPHNDSAASLPSNASSAQGPGTPHAPSVVAGEGSFAKHSLLSASLLSNQCKA